MAIKTALQRNILFILLLLVLGSNLSLYHTSFGLSLLPQEPSGVVIGSMIDLALVSPILFIAWKRKWSWKNVIIGIASGLVLARFLIPIEYLEPFEAVTWAGFAVEGILLIIEVSLIVVLVKYMPKIIHSAKNSSLPFTFSFANAVDKHAGSALIIKVICSELLMFYYTFACWRKKPQLKPNQFTMHQKTSMIAFQVMVIHAIIFETVGIHWWLHEKSIVISLILLIFNLYSVFFFLGDIQALRLNPLQVTSEGIHVSLGLMKRMEIKWTDIEAVIEDSEQLQHKPSKNAIEFIARDFEKVYPDVILKLKQPVKAHLIMGIEKEFEEVPLKVDETGPFIAALKKYLSF